MVERRQTAVRLSPEGEARLRALAVRMTERLHFRVSFTGVMEAALVALEKEYPPGPGEAGAGPASAGASGKAKGRGRKGG